MFKLLYEKWKLSNRAKSYSLKYRLHVIATGTKVIKAACCRQYVVVVETGEGKNLEIFAAENLSLSFSKDFSCRVRFQNPI